MLQDHVTKAAPKSFSLSVTHAILFCVCCGREVNLTGKVALGRCRFVTSGSIIGTTRWWQPCFPVVRAWESSAVSRVEEDVADECLFRVVHSHRVL